MDRNTTQPRTLTLKEVLEGAERAQQRVSAWPKWKRELSASPSMSGAPKHTSTSKKSSD